jgi:hypothetical protein
VLTLISLSESLGCNNGDFSKKIMQYLFLREAIFVSMIVPKQCFGKYIDVRTQGTNVFLI